MKSLAEHMSFYHRYHTKASTKLTHFIGVPIIVLSIMMILNWFTLGVRNGDSLNIMWLAVVLLSIYYAFLHWRLAIGMLIIFSIMGIIAHWLAYDSPNWIGGATAAALFVIGWVIQLIGHQFEGKKPALVDNFFQIFIAPIFLLAELLFLLGWLKALKKEVLARAQQ